MVSACGFPASEFGFCKNTWYSKKDHDELRKEFSDFLLSHVDDDALPIYLPVIVNCPPNQSQFYSYIGPGWRDFSRQRHRFYPYHPGCQSPADFATSCSLFLFLSRNSINLLFPFSITPPSPSLNQTIFLNRILHHF